MRIKVITQISFILFSGAAFCQSNTEDSIGNERLPTDSATHIKLKGYRPVQSLHFNNEISYFKNDNSSPEQQKLIFLETREVEAMRKQDTVGLLLLWSRDFSLDDINPKRLQSNGSNLPLYTYLSRTVESVSVYNNMAYTRGIEVYMQVDKYEKFKGAAKRKFSHVWRNNDGSWKLISKIYSEIRD